MLDVVSSVLDSGALVNIDATLPSFIRFLFIVIRQMAAPNVHAIHT